MNVYIAFLRGINVGGHNKISMSDLKKLFVDLGFHDTITYIQSGNIVFKAENKEKLLIEKAIKQGIGEKFSLKVEVIVKLKEELQEIVDGTPFKEAFLATGEKIYLTVFSKKPSDDAIKNLSKVEGEGDKIVIEDKVAYILCKKGYSETVYSNNFIEKTLSIIATTRNLQTMQKLEIIGSNLASKKDEFLAE
jgi:uncharacterized protein (DUF1697 family)